MNELTMLAVALVLDALAGDPRWLPHPVVAMGKGIAALERLFNRPQASPASLRWRGVVTVNLLVLATGFSSWGVIYLAGLLSPALAWLVGLVMLYYTLAGRSLAQAALSVWRPLAAEDIESARRAIGMFVGRDTQALDEGEIARATVETVAENLADGFVAPLMYALIGGPPLAMVYKVINTMDSMLGYKSPQLLHFGWAAARLDDIANYLPARLAALLLLVAGMLRGINPGPALATWRRDAAKHPSPNGGATEAVMAGLLGVALGGVNFYQGVASSRGVLGQMRHPLSRQTIRQSLVIYCLAWFVAAILACGLIYFTRGWLLPWTG